MIKTFQGSCFCAGEGRSKGKVLYCFGEVSLMWQLMVMVMVMCVPVEISSHPNCIEIKVFILPTVFCIALKGKFHQL